MPQVRKAPGKIAAQTGTSHGHWQSSPTDLSSAGAGCEIICPEPGWRMVNLSIRWLVIHHIAECGCVVCAGACRAMRDAVADEGFGSRKIVMETHASQDSLQEACNRWRPSARCRRTPTVSAM
jgi:hypothetical protein